MKLGKIFILIWKKIDLVLLELNYAKIYQNLIIMSLQLTLEVTLKCKCFIIYNLIDFFLLGYGDSTGWPSEIGVVKDVLVLYNNIKTFVSKNSKVSPQIYLYGHSLGAGYIYNLLSKSRNIYSRLYYYS